MKVSETNAESDPTGKLQLPPYKTGFLILGHGHLH